MLSREEWADIMARKLFDEYRKSHPSKFTYDQVALIKKRLGEGKTIREMGRRYMVLDGVIQAIKSGRTFSYVVPAK